MPTRQMFLSSSKHKCSNCRRPERDETVTYLNTFKNASLRVSFSSSERLQNLDAMRSRPGIFVMMV